MYLYKVAPQSETPLKSRICKILRSINLALGPLVASKPDDMFHFNLQAKLSMILCCNEEQPIYDLVNTDTITGILTNLFMLVNSQFKSGFSQEIRDMTVKSPFLCPCVKNMFLFVMDKMTPKVFWAYFSRLLLNEPANSTGLFYKCLLSFFGKPNSVFIIGWANKDLRLFYLNPRYL